MPNSIPVIPATLWVAQYTAPFFVLYAALHAARVTFSANIMTWMRYALYIVLAGAVLFGVYARYTISQKYARTILYDMKSWRHQVLMYLLIAVTILCTCCLYGLGDPTIPMRVVGGILWFLSVPFAFNVGKTVGNIRESRPIFSTLTTAVMYLVVFVVLIVGGYYLIAGRVVCSITVATMIGLVLSAVTVARQGFGYMTGNPVLLL
jgi:hypothetical protein